VTQIDNKGFKGILQEAIEKDGDFMKDLLSFMLQQLLEHERDMQMKKMNQKKNLWKNYKEQKKNMS